MAHIPSLFGVTIMAALCYMLAHVTMTGAEMGMIIASLLGVYTATVIWYLKTTM